MIITIDGPTASGKSTISRLLAAKLGYYYLYTGLLYRAVAYLLMVDGHDIDTIEQIDTAHVATITDSERLFYQYDAHNQEQIFWDGVLLTPFLKSPVIDQAASRMSTNNEIRKLINELQRSIAQKAAVVIDGRDAGSIVFPHAAYKFFLTADESERVQRWYHEQRLRGHQLTLQDAQQSLAVRDGRDMQRAHAPLIVPAGAYTIDTSSLTTHQVVQEIIAIVLR